MLADDIDDTNMIHFKIMKRNWVAKQRIEY